MTEPPSSTDIAPSRSVGGVMVTYNSATVARRAVESLARGSLAPEVLVIVDNGSGDTTYLDAVASEFPFVQVVKLETNVGYCAGNNRGFDEIGDRHLLLLNPDAFVSEEFLEGALKILAEDTRIGAVGPKLLGADPRSGRPTGLIDSAGIAQTRWGRFFDRGMGLPDTMEAGGPEDATALCAAAMLIRRDAIGAVLATDGHLFDEKFFMYKEDIDLSFRLQRLGWRTVYAPELTVLHCRGWKRDRRLMPAWARRRSLINEWRLWRRGWTPGRSRWAALPYLALKSVRVALGR